MLQRVLRKVAVATSVMKILIMFYRILIHNIHALPHNPMLEGMEVVACVSACRVYYHMNMDFSWTLTRYIRFQVAHSRHTRASTFHKNTAWDGIAGVTSLHPLPVQIDQKQSKVI
jgi:hypothetical protein